MWLISFTKGSAAEITKRTSLVLNPQTTVTVKSRSNIQPIETSDALFMTHTTTLEEE